ncbi:putative ribonuclease H-like domain-containing protein [Tanacetum coccineum]
MFSLGRCATLEVTHVDLFGDEIEMDMSNLNTSYQFPTTPNTRIHKDHLLDHVIGDIQSGVQTRGMTKNTNGHRFISAVYEGKTHEDFHTCLFAYFLSQEEQKRIAKALSDPAWVDVKSAFLYGTIEEEAYVCQPPRFEDPDYPNKVYKVVKALYGLHQALRSWYRTLAKYLLDNGFQRRKIDQTLFIRKQKGDILLVQVYVDDIIFGSTNKELCTEFEKLMHDKFQMSSMGELNFYLDIRTASTPMDTEKSLLKDSDGDDVDVHLYRSMIGSLMYLTSSRPDIIDYTGESLDRKVTIEGCQFLGCRLISWQCKKQIVVATSSTKAKYVAAASCCRQVLWIQNQMLDYGYNFMHSMINIDNNSTICIVKNLVSHTKTKHIDIRYHFIRDCYDKKLIQVVKIHTDHNFADILTKALDVGRFQYLVASFGMLNP